MRPRLNEDLQNHHYNRKRMEKTWFSQLSKNDIKTLEKSISYLKNGFRYMIFLFVIIIC